MLGSRVLLSRYLAACYREIFPAFRSPALPFRWADDWWQSALIMHLTREDGLYYFVQTEGGINRYVAGKAQAADPDADQAGIAVAAAEEEGNHST